MLAEASLPWLLVAINLPHSVKAKCAHNRQRGSSNWLPITRLWIKDMERGGRAQYGSAVTFILTLWASQERKGLEIVCVYVWVCDCSRMKILSFISGWGCSRHHGFKKESVLLDVWNVSDQLLWIRKGIRRKPLKRVDQNLWILGEMHPDCQINENFLIAHWFAEFTLEHFTFTYYISYISRMNTV